MTTFNSLLLTDFYKTVHPFHYPDGTTMVYSNLTPRKSRDPEVKHVVNFGLQYFIKEYLIEEFNKNFFSRPKEEVINEYKRIMKNTTGDLNSYQHIEDLHDLGYLPVKIKSLPEGTLVPMGVPLLTIRNTHPKFYWVTNFLESLMSCIIWMPITNATKSRQFRKIFEKVVSESIGDTSIVDFMGHDFSFRGMSGLEASIISGMAHLLSFKGTDTIPAILALEKYYGADVEKELIGWSCPATEHSCMSSGTGVHGEFETFKKLITKIHPSGIVSIVSDTFNLWDVLTDFIPRLKNEILARDGKVVIRGDSGDPVDIICGVETIKVGGLLYNTKDVEPPMHFGLPDYKVREGAKPVSENERKGIVELLWDTFGGSMVNGYKVLNEKCGAIYGDSVNIERAKQISARLMAKGFSPVIIYGIGSFSMQYTTRDQYSLAVKATAIENNGKLIEIFKDPITDDGLKKSARGLLRVDEVDGVLTLKDRCTATEEDEGLLETTFLDGKLVRETTLSEIRKRLDS